MNKEELIKATQILQKHIPNRFPLKNSYIDAMEEYALWYHEELSKLSQHDVSNRRELLIAFKTWEVDNDIKNLLPDQLADFYLEESN